MGGREADRERQGEIGREREADRERGGRQRERERERQTQRERRDSIPVNPPTCQPLHIIENTHKIPYKMAKDLTRHTRARGLREQTKYSVSHFLLILLTVLLIVQ